MTLPAPLPTARKRSASAAQKRFMPACTHGVLSGPAMERISDSPIKELVTLDTIAIPEEKMIDKIRNHIGCPPVCRGNQKNLLRRFHERTVLIEYIEKARPTGRAFSIKTLCFCKYALKAKWRVLKPQRQPLEPDENARSTNAGSGFGKSSFETAVKSRVGRHGNAD